MAHTRCLAIVAKEPLAGQVKTRLAATIGADAALALYRAFLADTLALAREVEDTDIALACWPPDAQASFQARHPEALVFPQRGADFGARLLGVFEQVHAMGYAQCVLIGSDSPSLPAAYVRQAFALLAEAPAVIGPSVDGGYYLLGLRTPQPELFQAIAWSTDRVFQQTMEHARAVFERVATLPVWYDIDTEADLIHLWKDLVGRADGITRATLVELQRHYPPLPLAREAYV